MGSIPERGAADDARDRLLRGMRNGLLIVLGATLFNSQLAQWLRPHLGLEPLPRPWSILEGWVLCWVPAIVLALVMAPWILRRRRS